MRTPYAGSGLLSTQHSVKELMAVGIHPDTELFKDIVKMDPAGYILADETCATSAPGIYAAGDCRKKQLRQVITAVADGANAATSAFNYISL